MLLAVAALLFQFPVFSSYNNQASEKMVRPAAVTQAADSLPIPAETQNSVAAKQVLMAERLPSDAEAPVAFTPGALVATPVSRASSAGTASAAEPASPVSFEPAPFVPAYRPPVRAVSDQWQNRKWLALSIAAHGAAGFDAYSTRRVISSVPGAQEMNPFLRPFAGNASMYLAVQVAPTLLDLLSRRMMNSSHAWARHTWWLPQAVSAVVSVSSGVHNLGVYNSR